ncbi:hypothetical protein J2Y55_005366 [Bosea sp. BE125]|uniref:hypothetical protein n=1 Tax=unclassified Bosea (in: a-proteobacteria) TaxID=2653178 RepID=UPI002858C18C|nr:MULTISPECIES: hypothetical protein [unclassified Bosea (in: a-proteobacteria)]MDR6874332.1 hypothetical protein [Bosea sp. BE125]WNJ91001.1 hypothetical protein RMR04_01445 [Bosea sp. 685]
MLRSLLLLPLLALSACVIPNSRSNTVVVTDTKSVVEKCQKLGELEGASPLGKVLLRDQARDAALARLKAGGAELGATHVESSVADIKWKGPSTAGTAYKCGT